MKALIICAVLGVGACWWTESEIAAVMASTSAANATPATADVFNHRPPMPAHAGHQQPHDVQVASAARQ